ncbi:uncharacterized protein LOC126101592 [Schistocerca cancellata]|uniref:uncharacterized protein LOC126101592 n=1 Tax=Schistocerca cancellata TaxID=274614 RepID=UPI0021190A77|nr:uncharacterized protein LOC126101592 [Schistocerca cancellata]
MGEREAATQPSARRSSAGLKMAAGAVSALRSFVNKTTATLKPAAAALGGTTTPCVGFRVASGADAKKLNVTLIGGRHLPPSSNGYVFKLRLFPGRERHETGVAAESWPSYNANFSFSLPADRSGPGACFLVVTGYALEARGSRRVIGAATWRPGDPEGELWRDLQPLGTGRTGAAAGSGSSLAAAVSRPNQCLLWITRQPDALSLGVAKLKWTLTEIRDLEARKARVYLKLEVFEGDRRTASHNSKPFTPGISVYLTADDDAVLQVPMPDYVSDPDGLAMHISLCMRPSGKLGSRVVLGCAILSSDDGGEGAAHLVEAFQTPSTAVNKWHPMLKVT